MNSSSSVHDIIRFPIYLVKISEYRQCVIILLISPMCDYLIDKTNV